MKYHHVFTMLLAVTLLVWAERGHGEETQPSNTTWEAEARDRGLSEADIASLTTNRILITDHAFKQIFIPYLANETPLFITSDSLLNAYHVLFEESVLRLETARAARLPDIIKIILKNLEDADTHLKGKPDLVSMAKKRAMLVPGIALRLMDDSFRFKDDKLNTILDQETKRIVAAKDVSMPEWLGKPDSSFAALDYSRYTPRGFYTRSEVLMRYYRAVSWLQSIPFRVSKDEELLAMLMLGNSVTHRRLDNYAKMREIYGFFHAYSSFMGAGDDWDIMDAEQEAQNKLIMDLNSDALQKRRESLTKMAEDNGKGPLINDQIRFAMDGTNTVAEPTFRIISAYRTPSALLFQRTTDPRTLKRSYPTGLEIAVSLGSTFASRSLNDPQKEDILKTIDSCKTYFKGHSLYFEYLDALRTLLDKPEPDAPDFLRHEAWQAKSCNTVLAGWAQISHTWALQSKQTAFYAGAGMLPGAFVEPEPEFFGRMADLADKTRKLLKRSGAFEPDYTDVIQELEKLTGIVGKVGTERELMEREDRIGLDTALMIFQPDTDVDSKEHFKEKKELFATVTADIKNGQVGRHPGLEAMLKEHEYDLEELWNRIERASRRLEVIAHKQLRNIELSESEICFLKAYGENIAGIMLYGGNSYEMPMDDSPRIVDVYANPREGKYFHVGISRPRQLYVLYPWHGKSILCMGAVMPYHEFLSPTRLTDADWKEKLDSNEFPPIPVWLSPIVSGGRLKKANLTND